jgi:hypothetical protein
VSQSKKRSITEVICNTLTGLVIAYFVWNLAVVPMAFSLGWNMNALLWWQVTTFNMLFTVVSVARGYFWRRLFNRGD